MAYENLVRAVLSNASTWTFTKAAAPYRVPPQEGTVLLIDSEQRLQKAEYITYTGLTDNGSSFTLTGVERAQEGSAQEMWSAGAILLQPNNASMVNKIIGVESGATKNATDAQLRDRTKHTGKQAIDTVTGLQEALNGKATTAQGEKADTALQEMPHSFNKQDRSARLFELSGTTLQTAQPVSLDVDGTIITLATGVEVTLPTLASHTDYMIYCDQSGALSAQPWDDAAPANSRAVGGFHVYHTTATINPHSIWDLGYRPTANPRGMTQCPTGDWVDIYLMDVDYGINGYSRGGVTIADGSSPPKIPAIYGGNGTATYGSLTWFEAVDLAAAAGKRLLTYAMFTAAAFGVVERQAVGTDPVTTKYQAGHRSACGMEQATGCLWQWGEDINGTTATGAGSWQDITDGRGDIYTHSIRAVLLGANWGNASYSGSRASIWSIAPSYSNGSISARASCGHMTL
jgi:hypothetical protein